MAIATATLAVASALGAYVTTPMVFAAMMVDLTAWIAIAHARHGVRWLE